MHRSNQVWNDLLAFYADRRAAVKGDKFAIEMGFSVMGIEVKCLACFIS